MKTYIKIGLNYVNDYRSANEPLQSFANYFENNEDFLDFKISSILNYYHNENLDYEEVRKYLNVWDEKDSDPEIFSEILKENNLTKERFEELDDSIEYSSKNEEIIDNFIEDEFGKIVKKFDLELDYKIDYGFSYFIEKSRYEEFKNYNFPNYIYHDFLEDEPDYDENFNEIDED